MCFLLLWYQISDLCAFLIYLFSDLFWFWIQARFSLLFWDSRAFLNSLCSLETCHFLRLIDFANSASHGIDRKLLYQLSVLPCLTLLPSKLLYQLWEKDFMLFCEGTCKFGIFCRVSLQIIGCVLIFGSRTIYLSLEGCICERVDVSGTPNAIVDIERWIAPARFALSTHHIWGRCVLALSLFGQA